MFLHDAVIIGGGPAGLTAGIYLCRAGFDAVLVDRSPVLGGQMNLTEKIENYPGYLSISGPELAKKMEVQAKKLGLKIVTAEVTKVKLTQRNEKVIETNMGEVKGLTVIVASGSEPKKLGVKGEKEFLGRGVSYCATCDGPFFKNKEVAVVGGGDAAVTEALFLTKIAKKVLLIHRRNELKAQKVLREKALQNKKIQFIWNTAVKEIIGNGEVRGIVVKNLKNNVEKIIGVDALFIYIGRVPNTGFIDVKKDEKGFILTDKYLRTSEPGIFAAGDCRSASAGQISSAVGDGALAAFSVQSCLEGIDKEMPYVSCKAMADCFL